MKAVIETVGWAAAVMMLSAYVLLSTGGLSARSRVCHWLNILSGAGLPLRSLMMAV
jgi:hypothetical protein